MNWTTPAGLRAQVQKLWDKGQLLACLIDDEGLFPLRLTLKGPGSAELSERFDEVRAWIAALQHGAIVGIESSEQGGRHVKEVWAAFATPGRRIKPRLGNSLRRFRREGSETGRSRRRDEAP